VQRVAASVFNGDILIFHFYADFQTLIRQENRHHRSLREAPFPSAIARIFFFEKPVHGPLDVLSEILSEEQSKFVGIWNFWRTALFFLFFFASFTHRRCNFFVSNGADAEFILGEECRIQGDLIPISKRPSRFQTDCLRAAAAIEPFELRFGCYVDTPGKTHLDLLSEKMIRRAVAKPLTFIKFAEEKCPWRQHVCIHRVGKTAARKSRRRAVRAWHFLACDDNCLLCCCLREG
jgi:hypothetical protein